VPLGQFQESLHLCEGLPVIFREVVSRRPPQRRSDMNRRDLIAAGATLVALSTAARAQVSHDHHDAAAPTPLLDAASTCVKVGMVCIDHCFQAFAAGDTSLAGCAREVDQMLSTCGTLARLASLRSSHLPAMRKSLWRCVRTATRNAASTPISTPRAKRAPRPAQPARRSAGKSPLSDSLRSYA
jgi:Cys-rich four helix bundle protein (predicted Tat secretion target)